MCVHGVDAILTIDLCSIYAHCTAYGTNPETRQAKEDNDRVRGGRKVGGKGERSREKKKGRDGEEERKKKSEEVEKKMGEGEREMVKTIINNMLSSWPICIQKPGLT